MLVVENIWLIGLSTAAIPIPYCCQRIVSAAWRRWRTIPDVKSCHVRSTRLGANVKSTVGTRERLLAAALEIVSDQGYEAASVGAVTARAGLASGTLYRYFPSKPDLFVEVFRFVCDREVAAAAAAADFEGTPVERLLAVFETFSRRALSRPRLAWALIAEPVDPLVEQARLDYRREYRDRIAAGLRLAIDEGELPDQDASLVAAALVGGVADALVGPVSPIEHHDVDADAVVGAIVTLVARAIGAHGHG